MEKPIKACILQSTLAFLVMSLVLAILTLEHALIMVSMGATAFIIFAMPRQSTARPKNVIGGHLIGLFSGSLCSLIPHTQTLLLTLACALAVGLSISLMVLTRTHHPPASGTALGVVLTGFSTRVALGVLIGALLLSLFHCFLRDRLVDL